MTQIKIEMNNWHFKIMTNFFSENILRADMINNENIGDERNDSSERIITISLDKMFMNDF